MGVYWLLTFNYKQLISVVASNCLWHFLMPDKVSLAKCEVWYQQTSSLIFFLAIVWICEYLEELSAHKIDLVWLWDDNSACVQIFIRIMQMDQLFWVDLLVFFAGLIELVIWELSPRLENARLCSLAI